MNHVPSNIVFLLGGYDLEMLTIKQMLERRKGCVVLDHHLRWENAVLSAYQEELQQHLGCEFFGIELREDIPTPNCYHRIDHHNDMSDAPCALEQVANYLGESLNHYQQLVAANDKGYIPAMQAMGASEEEILDIRRSDRKAQGVSKQEEMLAIQSITDNLMRQNDLLLVKSLSSHFSPICDRLYPYKRLLVYTDDEWLFCGEGKVELATSLALEIRQKRVFHGGGSNGYIGCVKHAFNRDEINNFVERIKQEYGHA